MVDLSGAGIVESTAEFVQSAANADEWIDLGDVALNAAAVGLDMLGIIANPVDALGSTAIAFIIEQLAPLRAVLDWTTGDPDSVKNAITSWNDTAVALDAVGNAHRSAPARHAPTWINGGSDSAQGCIEVMAFRSDQILGAGMACIAMAQLTANAGRWIAAARGVIRDIIAAYVWELVQKAAAKLAVAPLTFGASMAEFVVDAMIRLSMALRKIQGVITRVVTRLSEISQSLARLATMFDKLAGVSRRTETNVWFQHGTLIPNPVGAPLKFGLDAARESAKIDSTERQTRRPDHEDDIDDLHRQHDDGVDGRVISDQARNREDIEKTPPRGYETEDWWSRKGTL